ncbi:MAG: hypothetical protein R2770_19360 [Acidimicrobiales bacterium]|nr:hypothetical protein [Acidimicrobiales bacterium]
MIDLAGFVSDLKEHAIDHGFHIHDERHFVETYSMRQAWEVDLHPEEACGGPLDLHLALEAEPRTLLAFEDAVIDLGDELPGDEFFVPLSFNWALPPMTKGPDLLVLATDLAGIGGTILPIEVSAIDSFASITDPSERTLAIVGRIQVSLSQIVMRTEDLCEVLDLCQTVSTYLLDRAPIWLDEI